MSIAGSYSADPTILMTVDVEDWFQVENLRHYTAQKNWSEFELRVESNVRRLLGMFDEFQIRATFFVLGWIAERCPELVREISNQGHEVASHGYLHRHNSTLTAPQLREDLYRSKMILEKITGRQADGYRAPNFSITKTMEDLLLEIGYRYDSSYNDFSLYRRYGALPANWEKLPDGPMRSDRGLVEFPISNLKLGRMVLPWGGGAYFRLWPPFLFHIGVSRILQRTGYYLFYCHPWEFDPGQPRIKNVSCSRRFRHYANLSKTEGRLKAFLRRFWNCTFSTCANKVENSLCRSQASGTNDPVTGLRSEAKEISESTQSA